MKPVRKLTGILELPGIFGDFGREWFGRCQALDVVKLASHVEPNTLVAPYLLLQIGQLPHMACCTTSI
jgi:hypothetical protein